MSGRRKSLFASHKRAFSGLIKQYLQGGSDCLEQWTMYDRNNKAIRPEYRPTPEQVERKNQKDVDREYKACVSKVRLL